MRKIIFCFSFLFCISCAPTTVKIFSDGTEPLIESTLEGTGLEKILLISINGVISNEPGGGMFKRTPGMVQEIKAQLKKAGKDPAVKGIILKINSPGGTITSSDIIYKELVEFKKRNNIKIVSVFMDVAASGGYYLALPSDVIYAHPSTITGSVGAIFMTSNLTGLIEKIGIKFNVKKTGRNKDIGSPYRESTSEENEIMQNLIDQMGRNFLSLVSKHRKIEKNDLDLISTARVFSSYEAKKLGLIDNIGYVEDGLKKLKSICGLKDNAKVIVYRREYYADDNVYNILSEADYEKIINIKLTGNFKTGLYYLWLPGF